MVKLHTKQVEQGDHNVSVTQHDDGVISIDLVDDNGDYMSSVAIISEDGINLRPNIPEENCPFILTETGQIRVI